MEGNLLYYGDNLDILRRYVKDESVDLVYLDPPFKSNQDYNVLFAEHGVQAAAQIKAFEDTWRWDKVAAAAYDEVVTVGGRVADAMVAFRKFLGDNDMLAYLSMMAPRLVELRRVLKETGSIYLHCDPAASHYLKMLMDAVYGPAMFRNEVIWRRTTAHSSAKRFGPVHDTILYFARSDDAPWFREAMPHTAKYLADKYRYTDRRGVYRLSDLTGAGIRHGETGLPWRGIDVTARGRHWAYPPQELDNLDADGRVYWPGKPGGVPAYKRYLTAKSGQSLQDIWDDISPINSMAAERLGYPTQKPEALLERIIQASSAEGDTVLDPFCGCGTTIAAAQKMNRRWIGIDVTHLAIGLIKSRLTHAYGAAARYEVIGEPTTLDDAAQLADEDKFQFQAWALGLVGARQAGSNRKGADKGIDGHLYFNDGTATQEIILSVKGGKLKADDVRALSGVVHRTGAQIGVLISFQSPTNPMRADAASAGFYESPWGKHPRIQLLTIEELLDGKRIDYPPAQQVNITLKKAPKYKAPVGQQLQLAAEPAAPEYIAEADDDEVDPETVPDQLA